MRSRSLIIADFISGEKLATDPPKNDKDMTWQKRMEDKQRNKAVPNNKRNPPGMFSKSPSGIANDLKNHNTDYDTASKKLNSYINRQGRNLQGGDRKRLYDAKEHLKNAYGEQNKPSTDTTTTAGRRVRAIAEQPIYALPPGHNLDDPTWNLLKVEPDNREKLLESDPVMSRVSARLRASVQNTTQNPNTRMSSVEEQASSTVVNNLDESSVAPPGFAEDDRAIMEPVEGDATFDSLDTKFEDVNDPTQHAYATAGLQLSSALRSLI